MRNEGDIGARTGESTGDTALRTAEQQGTSCGHPGPLVDRAAGRPRPTYASMTALARAATAGPSTQVLPSPRPPDTGQAAVANGLYLAYCHEATRAYIREEYLTPEDPRTRTLAGRRAHRPDGRGRTSLSDLPLAPNGTARDTGTDDRRSDHRRRSDPRERVGAVVTLGEGSRRRRHETAATPSTLRDRHHVQTRRASGEHPWLDLTPRPIRITPIEAARRAASDRDGLRWPAGL